MGGLGTFKQRQEWTKKYRSSEKGKASRLAYQRSDKMKEYYRNYYNEHRFKYALRSAKSRAKEAGLEFSITSEDLNIPEVCPILLIPMNRHTGFRAENSPSVDRIDNSKGYTKDNIAVISAKANRIKSDLTLEQAERLLKYMKKELN